MQGTGNCWKCAKRLRVVQDSTAHPLLCMRRMRVSQVRCMCAQGISKNLVHRAFPEPTRPDYLTSEEFLKFTPTEDFMSLPGEILRTEFRLVVTREVGP